MENNEELVQSTENVVEQATEELVDGQKVEEVTTEEPKLYTEAELNSKVDDLLAKKIARKEAKIRRELEDKYADDLELAYVTKKGIGVDNPKKATEEMKKFYSERNVDIPDYQRNYSSREEELLADAEAKDIIASGYEDIVEETDRLANKGTENMTSRERLVFTKLAQERQKQEDLKALASIGVGKEALEDKNFKEFAEHLDKNMSIKDKYDFYSKFKPKPTVEPMGSMKGVKSKDSTVKDFYTKDEALQFTREDLDKNPELFKAIEKSMAKW
nr:MAG TPA: hypothetical protein [Caudoviricetes sp.]